MTRIRCVRWLVALFATTVGLAAQEPPVPVPVPNPAKANAHLGNAQSIRSGMTLYRVRCADCHGLDAKGYRGPDLTAVLAGDTTDEHLFLVMRKGVPGTDMPPSTAPDDDLLLTIAYLRN